MENLKQIDKDEFVDRGKRIYKRLKPKLEPMYKGKVVAIDVESGDYILGDDELDAALNARRLFPDKIFYFIRIGYPVVHKLRKK